MPVVQRQDLDKKRKLWAETHTKLSGKQTQQIVQIYHRHVAAHQNAALFASNAAVDAIGRQFAVAYKTPEERMAHVEEEAKTIAAASAVGAATAEAERDEMGAYHEIMLLLTESWNLEDPDKPGEVLPKSREGFERADAADLALLRNTLMPIINTAFPN